MKLRTLLIATLGVAAIAGAADTASAATWYHHHRVYHHTYGQARRAQVNTHITAANNKIQWEHRTGQISAQQAHNLYVHTKHLRIRTKRVASNQGGNLSAAQQADLNHETANTGHH